MDPDDNTRIKAEDHNTVVLRTRRQLAKNRHYTNTPVKSVNAHSWLECLKRKKKGDLSAALGVANF